MAVDVASLVVVLPETVKLPVTVATFIVPVAVIPETSIAFWSISETAAPLATVTVPKLFVAVLNVTAPGVPADPAEIVNVPAVAVTAPLPVMLLAPAEAVSAVPSALLKVVAPL